MGRTEQPAGNILSGRRAAFLSLGCKVNAYETEAMQQLFEKAGAITVGFAEKADIYVVNTCTVTNMADRKSRQMLHRAKKQNPEGIVVAVGCYVQAAEEEVKQDYAVDVVVGNNQKKEIVGLVAEYLQGKEARGIPNIFQEKEYEELKLETVREKTRAFIKIQDGCNQYCAYCIIPFARGRIRSRKEEDVLAEAECLAGQGYQEIVLTGIHLSSYGFEKYSENDRLSFNIPGKEVPLLSLILRLNKIPGILRIRLGSLEPRIITEEFVEGLAKTKVCPHFHLSLQSGCDTTLARMNRKYDTARYWEGVRLLRGSFEHPAVTTDIIAGFPGETTEEFARTVEFLQKVGFARLHIFKYSRRHGTKADKMPGQVPEETKAARSDILLELEVKMRKEYEQYFVGKETSVLFEEQVAEGGKRYMAGHNERYVKFLAETEEDLSGQAIRGLVLDEFIKESRRILVKKQAK